MDDHALWELSLETWAALENRYEPAVQSIVEQSGLDGRGWGLLLAALTFEPEETTPAHLTVRNPYTAAELYLARLRICADKGYLEEYSAGEFRLTVTGRSSVEQFITQARQVMMDVDPLAPQDSSRLAKLYKQLVEHCLKTPPPPESWSITLSSKLMPSEEPPLPYIEQAMSCLGAYRDDAHLAAWQDTGLSATSLEMMTILWRKEVGSFDEIIKKLVFRGYAEQVYEKALDELRDFKYMSGSRRSPGLTPEGIAFREKIEQDTNRYFFTPWSCLSEPEKNEMGRFLVELTEGLKETTANNR
ncbi:MAG TPA: hypothetical protein VI776_12130 [Anaerolineales bacterium]|nr:hypothetical protein [Anaerolineales bacterium]